jgi:flagellar motor switch protein FliG
VKPAASALVLLPKKLRIEAVRRLAEMQSFSTDHVKKISLVLHKKLSSLGEQSRRAHGGIKAVADILNRVDAAEIKTILEAVEQEDAQLALAIRNYMFTFEDFAGVPANGLRELLAQVDKKTMALALKGASEEMKSHIYKTMSQRAAQMLKEDMEALGPMRMRQVQQAQQEVVQLARNLEAAGKLTLKSHDDDAYMV